METEAKYRRVNKLSLAAMPSPYAPKKLHYISNILGWDNLHLYNYRRTFATITKEYLPDSQRELLMGHCRINASLTESTYKSVLYLILLPAVRKMLVSVSKVLFSRATSRGERHSMLFKQAKRTLTMMFPKEYWLKVAKADAVEELAFATAAPSASAAFERSPLGSPTSAADATSLVFSALLLETLEAKQLMQRAWSELRASFYGAEKLRPDVVAILRRHEAETAFGVPEVKAYLLDNCFDKFVAQLDAAPHLAIDLQKLQQTERAPVKQCFTYMLALSTQQGTVNTGNYALYCHVNLSTVPLAKQLKVFVWKHRGAQMQSLMLGSLMWFLLSALKSHISTNAQQRWEISLEALKERSR